MPKTQGRNNRAALPETAASCPNSSQDMRHAHGNPDKT